MLFGDWCLMLPCARRFGRTSVGLRAVIILLAIASSAHTLRATPPATTRFAELDERSLGTLPRPATQPILRAADATGCHVAYVGKLATGSLAAVHDGDMGSADIIDPMSIRLSGDGRHIAYVKTDEAGDHVVHDGREGPPFPRIVWNSVLLSADGRHVAYIVSDRTMKHDTAVVDGRPGPTFDFIPVATRALSADGQHSVYAARKGEKYLVVHDGVAGPEWDEVEAVSITPSGEHWLYTAFTGASMGLVVDGKSERPGTNPSTKLFFTDATFSADGKRVAYVFGTLQETSVVVSGQCYKLAPCDYQRRSFSFSPDGRRFAYALTDGQKVGVALDGRPGPMFAGVAAQMMTFSPDGEHFAYIAADKGRQFVVLDGRAGPEFSAIVGCPLAFSADSKHFAYVATEKPGDVAVIDGKKGPPYDRITEPGVVLAPSGGGYAYIGIRKNRWIIVIDGNERAEYDAIAAGPVYRSDGLIEFLATKGMDLYRVTAKPRGSTRPNE